jgi:F-type H+-transporting ATPase subunit gamma
MVAASKMRKAQERMRMARPYGEKIRRVAAHMAHALTEYKHPYLVSRETVKSVGIIVVTSDKGLCGALNSNVLRLTINRIREYEQAGVKVKLTAIGNKGFGLLQRARGDIVSHITGLGDAPSMEKLIGPVKVMLDAYINGEVDRVILVFTRFINTMKQEAQAEQLLPLAGELGFERDASWDYLYEPEPKAVIEALLTRYVEALIYQAVAENMASEQSARMVAMKAASDNAKNVIGELKLVYNKTRQAAITKELAEIVGGAAAV